jgi:hypothetical protein
MSDYEEQLLQAIAKNYYSEDFVMKLLKFTKKTMENYRSRGFEGTRIPVSTKVGKNILYKKTEFAKWAKERGIDIHV